MLHRRAVCRRTRRAVLGAVGLTASVLTCTPGAQAGAPAVTAGDTGRQFSVLAAEGVAAARVAEAARAAGATVERVNEAVGLLTVTATRDGFVERLRISADVAALSPVRVVGRVPELLGVPVALPAHRPGGAGADAPRPAAEPYAPAVRPLGPKGDPLDTRLWGLTAIGADKAREVQDGDRRVLVGVIDGGVDGRHPDLAPSFDRKRSRNFTRDIPTDAFGMPLDGPCEVPGCVDPADVDDSGHGTHVAGTIAAALNGRGISGAAPGVTLLNLRGGQDSGYFLLQPVVDAITHAADIGVDVLNMSFFVDPWVYHCPDSPTDTPDQRADQQVALGAMERAMRYADERGVTQLAAYGNAGRRADASPQLDLGSPNMDAAARHPRLVDRGSCRVLPQDLPQTLNVGAVGPSGAKSGYSNYGGAMSVSAPGGWTDDFDGTPDGGTVENTVLSTWPEGVARAEQEIDAAGAVTPVGKANGVLRECVRGACAYYRYAEGTSMATPHASAVAALIVSQYGLAEGGGRGLGLPPAIVRRILETTARPRSCGEAVRELLAYGGTCSGAGSSAGLRAGYTTFYGHGTIDAYAAVTRASK